MNVLETALIGSITNEMSKLLPLFGSKQMPLCGQGPCEKLTTACSKKVRDQLKKIIFLF